MTLNLLNITLCFDPKF